MESIIPRHEADKKMEYRTGDKYASEISKALQEHTGLMDARYYDFFIKSTFAYPGRWVLSGTDAMLKDEKSETNSAIEFFKAAGIVVNTPAVNSPDARWLEDAAMEHDFFNNPDTKSDFLDYLDLKKEYYEASTDKQKDVTAKAVRDYASWFRSEWQGKFLESEDENGNINKVEIE